MKNSSTRPLTALLLALSSSTLAGCSHSNHSSPTIVVPAVPAYQEWEPNDDAFSANDFGTLLPGDLFFIDGHSTDDGSDPFDGFAFISDGPIHVDFQLFHDGYVADLDVWLYDAQLDEVVGYFETAGSPERGGVDITDAGLEFHLLVTSYVGASNYSLEIAVSPLNVAFASAAKERVTARASEQTPDASERPGRRHLADEYERGERPAGRLGLSVYQEFDAESGLLLELIRFESQGTRTE